MRKVHLPLLAVLATLSVLAGPSLGRAVGSPVAAFAPMLAVAVACGLSARAARGSSLVGAAGVAAGFLYEIVRGRLRQPPDPDGGVATAILVAAMIVAVPVFVIVATGVSRLAARRAS